MSVQEGSGVTIRPADRTDADSLARIYNHYVTETVVTFEERPVSPGDMADRIGRVFSGNLPWLVAEREGIVLGFAYASKWGERSAYRYSVETTVYLDRPYVGSGLGTRLYQDLLDRLRGLNVHAAMGGIALPNDASVVLHERLGFRKVAHFPEVGYKFDRWIDVGYWELIL
jgi:L-amino acid N-acyltransferase YncA